MFLKCVKDQAREADKTFYMYSFLMPLFRILGCNYTGLLTHCTREATKVARIKNLFPV